ncbi:phosphoribosyltransferase [Haloglomus litoreum]|uniref:phosphoribosyltransferase n=1 Tax=Haloglomus litoreum TaxID=3034026 RepID=UPI0023E8BA43|nr:phosphoribosyltransferase [Haloglomus sp. DT116]
MSDLPDEFPCRLLTWDYIDGLARDLSHEVRGDYAPDTVVAIARGGLVPARIVCDYLDVDDLISIKVEHYVGTGEAGDGPSVKYPLADGAVADKDLLVVDDIADTGRTFQHTVDHLEGLGQPPAHVKTGALQLLPGSEAELDYVASYPDEFAWMVYPWNFVEDMCDLVPRLMELAAGERFSEDELYHLFYDYHDIDRVHFEVVQGDRLGEVLAELERRGVVETTGRGSAGSPEWRLV